MGEPTWYNDALWKRALVVVTSPVWVPLFGASMVVIITIGLPVAAVLALDLGTTFGFAFSDGRSGSFRLPSTDRRYYEFMVWLGRNVGPEVTTVAYERVKFRHASVAAGDVYGGLRAVVLAFCEANGKRVVEASPQQIKKHATGSARADKDAMVAAARKRFGVVADHNHADALWLLDLTR